jgi:16S rRNA (uracil1498-N3)-methyltransferase
MITILIPPGNAAGSIPLDDDEVHHLRVRRIDWPMEVRFTDGQGRVGAGRVTEAGGRLVLEPTSQQAVPRPVPRVLAIGAGDRERFAWLVEKATELGATDLLPVETERSRTVANRVRAGGDARLARRAREALKQCGAAWSPMVHPPMPLDAFLSSTHAGATVRWLGDASGSFPSAPGTDTSSAALVGPEGGFTPAERALVIDAGFTPARFGPHILRFETAALAALTLMQAHPGA